MLEAALEFLSSLFGQKFCLHGCKDYPHHLSLTNKWKLHYQKELGFSELYAIKTFLVKIIEEEKKAKTKLMHCSMLQEEFRKILQSTPDLIEKQDYTTLFTILAPKSRYLLIENSLILINEGIDPFTIKSTTEKLKSKTLFHSLLEAENSLHSKRASSPSSSSPQNRWSHLPKRSCRCVSCGSTNSLRRNSSTK